MISLVILFLVWLALVLWIWSWVYTGSPRRRGES